VEVNLQDLLVAARQLEMMADVYEDVVGKLQVDTTVDSIAFETDEVTRSWVALRNRFWEYAADTQDNLNETSVALIHYINAVCEQDTENAKDLLAEVNSFNDALARTEVDNETNIDDPLPVPDLNDPDQVIDVPSHRPANQPPEG
jgi:hypothetical protein